MTRIVHNPSFARVAGSLFAASLAACLSDPTPLPTDAGPDTGKAAPSHDAAQGVDATFAVDSGVPAADGPAPSLDATQFPDVGMVQLDAPMGGPAPMLDAYALGDGSASRCTISSTEVNCMEQQLTINTPAGSDSAAGTTYPAYARLVYYQIPLGTAPTAGWPAVFMFQGSFLSAQYTFAASSSEDYGMYYQSELVKALLDAGYAVLAPETLESGETYWQTNVSPYATAWSSSPDDLLIQMMLADVASGTFGPLDGASLFATGISSGGYMTSRMAVSYQGKFKALAIESGSYATCLSSECTVPALASTHPPTLFLHGNEDTVIVPESTVTAYVTALMTAGVATKEIDDPNGGHQWIPAAPEAVLAWFNTYR